MDVSTSTPVIFLYVCKTYAVGEIKPFFRKKKKKERKLDGIMHFTFYEISRGDMKQGVSPSNTN